MKRKVYNLIKNAVTSLFLKKKQKIKIKNKFAETAK